MMGALRDEGCRREGPPDRGDAAPADAKRPAAARRIVRFVCAFNGVCAVVCGAMMMAGAVGLLPEGADPFAGLVEAVRMLPLPDFMTWTCFGPGLRCCW